MPFVSADNNHANKQTTWAQLLEAWLALTSV